jgi:hypothetical protein
LANNTEIANLAIGHLGIGKEIENLDDESSAEARACRRFFEAARLQVLRDFPWGFATKFAALAVVEADPTDEWAFAYRYPSDCVNLRRILSGLRTDNRQSRVSFRKVTGSDGPLVYCSLSEAQAEYTTSSYEESSVTSDFEMALSYRLAHYIAPAITAGDPFKMKAQLLQLYALEIGMAQKNAANEDQPDEEPDSEFGRTRGAGVERDYPLR